VIHPTPMQVALKVLLAPDPRGHFELRKVRCLLGEIGIWCTYKELRIALRGMDAEIMRKRLPDGSRPRLVWGLRINLEAMAQLSALWSTTLEEKRKAEATKFAKKVAPPWVGAI
jgi:hypothetical protein